MDRTSRPLPSVDPARIEAELRALWEDVDGEGGAAVRSCALNLVAMCPAGAEPQDFPRVVAAITAEHPSRVLKVLADPAAKQARISATVSAHCHRPLGSDRQICCEQITVQAEGSAVDDLAGSIVPLLVGDLPVFVWWIGEPPLGSDRFRRMARLADRMLVDTARTRDDLATLAGLHVWQASGAARCQVGDLDWRRLTGWREILAALFDPPPRRAALSGLEQIRMTIPEGAGRRTQALYLAGWIGSRLGWSLRPATVRVSAQGFRGELDAGTHVVRVQIAPGDTFSLEVSDLEGEFRAAVRERDGGARVDVQVEGCLPQTRCEILEIPELSRLISRELEVGGVDPIYRATLAIAGPAARLWTGAA